MDYMAQVCMNGLDLNVFQSSSFQVAFLSPLAMPIPFIMLTKTLAKGGNQTMMGPKQFHQGES